MRKNGESDQPFKNRFTAERSRQLDLLPTKMQTAARKEHVNFSSQNIGLSPVMAGDRLRRLNSSIKEHQSMLGKLKRVVNVLKEHDSTLFQSNGLILKQGEEFAHDFNVKQIKCV